MVSRTRSTPSQSKNSMLSTFQQHSSLSCIRGLCVVPASKTSVPWEAVRPAVTTVELHAIAPLIAKTRLLVSCFFFCLQFVRRLFSSIHSPLCSHTIQHWPPVLFCLCWRMPEYINNCGALRRKRCHCARRVPFQSLIETALSLLAFSSTYVRSKI